MKVKAIFFIALVMICIIQACQSKASENFENGSVTSEADVEASIPTSKSESPTAGLNGLSNPQSDQANTEVKPQQSADKATKIVKDGNITIKVKEIDTAKSLVDKIIKQYGAYYEVDAFNSSEYHSQYDIKIRVKNDKFDLLVNQLMTIEGDIQHKDINARDVTEEFIDTESRLNSSKAYLKRYQVLLSRANSIKDIIEIENKIQEIQINIDAFVGKLKYLNDRVDYSTLTVALIENHEHYKGNQKDNFFEKIINSFKVGIDIILGLFLFLIKIWPLIILATILWYNRKKLLSRRNPSA